MQTAFSERGFAAAFPKRLAAVASGAWDLAEFDTWLAHVRIDGRPLDPTHTLLYHGAAAVGRLAVIAKNGDEEQPNTREKGEPHGET